MTRRDRYTRIITALSRAGRDREIHKALETVLVLRGLSALTDAALEDLATQVVASERGRWPNNRAKNSHQPTRRRERKMQLEKVDRYLDTIAARCEYGVEFRDSRPSYLDGAKHLANSR